MIKILIAATLVLLWLSLPVLAQDFSDGMTAAKKGDYAAAYENWYPLAESGHTSAQVNIGVLFANGLGRTRNEAEARIWYKRAADGGDKEGQYRLAVFLESGLGGPANPVEARRLYTLASEQGHLAAQFSLGSMYLGSRGGPKNDQEAIRWLTASASGGDARAQNKLGLINLGVLGASGDYTEALKWFRASAESGNADAQANLGDMYSHGWGVEKSDADAERFYRLAAQQGHERAKRNLLALLGARKDALQKEISQEETALSDMKDSRLQTERAATDKEEQVAAASANVRRLQNLADGIAAYLQQDYSTALSLLQPLAEGGDAKAQLFLGEMYADGVGVPRDQAAAAKLFQQAVDGGNADARVSLGIAFEEGSGVSRDYGRAAELYWTAAKQGNANGQFRLAIMYMAGKGVAQRPAMTLMWLQIAGRNGFQVQPEAIATLRQSLDAQTVETVDVATETCLASNYENCGLPFELAQEARADTASIAPPSRIVRRFTPIEDDELRLMAVTIALRELGFDVTDGWLPAMHRLIYIYQDPLQRHFRDNALMIQSAMTRDSRPTFFMEEVLYYILADAPLHQKIAQLIAAKSEDGLLAAKVLLRYAGYHQFILNKVPDQTFEAALRDYFAEKPSFGDAAFGFRSGDPDRADDPALFLHSLDLTVIYHQIDGGFFPIYLDALNSKDIEGLKDALRLERNVLLYSTYLRQKSHDDELKVSEDALEY